MVRPTPSGSVTDLTSDQGPSLTSTHFRGSEERPDDYPTDLPFRSGLQSALMHDEAGGRDLKWLKDPDPCSGRDDVADQLVQSGWVQYEAWNEGFGLSERQSFVRGGTRRVLTLNLGTSLSLSERPVDALP